MSKDMTSGNPLKIILLFSLPVLLGNIFQQFYNMVDTIIVGQYLGEDALAAVGSTGCLMFLLVGCIMGMTAGLTIITGQRFGARDYEGVRRSAAACVDYLIDFALVHCNRYPSNNFGRQPQLTQILFHLNRCLFPTRPLL